MKQPTMATFPRPLGPDPAATILERATGYFPFASSIRVETHMPPGTGLEVAAGDFVVAPDVYQAVRNRTEVSDAR